MAEILKGIKADFILSLNDHPEIRKLLKGFRIKPVQLKYSVAQKKLTDGNKLLIYNF